MINNSRIAFFIILPLFHLACKQAESSDESPDSFPYEEVATQTENSAGDQVEPEMRPEAQIKNSNKIEEQEQQHDFILKGTVVDKDGNPIQGINLAVIGSDEITVTDFSGNFELATTQNLEISINNLGLHEYKFIAKDYKKLEIILDDKGAITRFYCTNHNNAHPATTRAEMDKLTRTKQCVFF